MENNFTSDLNNNKPTTPPKNWLVESILLTVLCCMPLGIVAIMNATKVESLFAAGDYESAQRYSNEAKKWCKFGLIGGIVAWIAIIIFYGFAFMAALAGTH